MPVWAEESVDSFDVLLNQADKNKGGSKEVFNLSLETLQQQRQQLSTEQQEYLDYLLIFNLLYEGQYNEAINAFESLFTRAESVFVKIRTQSSLSNIYAFNRDYRAVFRALEYVTDMLPQLKDKELKHSIYLATANSYLLTDRFQLSLDFSGFLLNDNPNPFKRCRAMVYHQVAHIELQNNDNIHDDVFNEIFELCQSQKQYIAADMLALKWYAHQFSQLQDNNRNSDEINRLIAAVEETCLHIDAQQFKSILTGKDALLAQLHLANDNLNLAQKYAHQVLKDATLLGESKHMQKAYQVLEAIARLKNNYVMAYNYLAKRSDIESALMKDKLDKQEAFEAIQHDILVKELQLQQLGESNELLKVQQILAKKESLNQKLIMAWLALMVGLLLFWVTRVIIKRKKLETLVELDHLTKILNRKGIEDHVGQLLSRKSGKRQPVHLAIMDLDHFKKVNDECGHLTGDWVLKYVIYHLKSVLNTDMIIGRLGGEEFAILGSGLSNQGMLNYLERMRTMVMELDYSECHHPITLSASFGVASTETAGYSLQMLLTQADLALYQAKNNGRNQVVLYQPDGKKTPVVPQSPE
ncbi:GGDEF domain-containing protein [Marinicella sp. S6413]|nr:GGDEF domain-containing protein [Marinicella gelatinilytica]